MNYDIFYKENLPITGNWDDKWDIFISAYNLSDRVNDVFEKVEASEKHWLIFPDYDIVPAKIPDCGIIHEFEKFNDKDERRDEAEIIIEFLGRVNLSDKSICIDITGFIKPYMMTLVKLLMLRKIKKIDILFTEPKHYSKREKTSFAKGIILETRQIRGFEGIHIPDTSNDILVIGAGYDYELIKEIAKYIDRASKKISIYGFPSLRPDMYQQNILCATLAENAIGRSSSGYENDNHFAPANDPFITAQVLDDIIKRESKIKPISNLYLSPLATKPQALGFILFALFSYPDASIIYPITTAHSSETSKGISRIWKYTVEFP